VSEFWTGQSGEYGNPHAGEPIQEEWLESGQETGPPDAWAEMRPIPVKVQHDESELVSPQATSFNSYAIPLAPTVGGTGTLQPLQVCPHRYRRYKAKFLFTATGAVTIYVDKVIDRLMSNALGATFQIVIPAALTQSTQLMPEYDGEQPLYMVANAPGASVSVMDEGYKTVQ